MEFVLASGNAALFRTLSSANAKTGIPASLHEKCLILYRDYCLVGGMPEVVFEWLQYHDPARCMKIQMDLLATYRDDFNKYGNKIDPGLLSKIMLSSANALPLSAAEFNQKVKNGLAPFSININCQTIQK